MLELGLAAAGGDGAVVEGRLGDAETQVASLGQQPVFAVEVGQWVAGEHDAQDADGHGGHHDSRSEAFAAMPENVERAYCQTQHEADGKDPQVGKDHPNCLEDGAKPGGQPEQPGVGHGEPQQPERHGDHEDVDGGLGLQQFDDAFVGQPGGDGVGQPACPARGVGAEAGACFGDGFAGADHGQVVVAHRDAVAVGDAGPVQRAGQGGGGRGWGGTDRGRGQGVGDEPEGGEAA